MLEGLVASLLNRFLGAYVKNFDPKQLNIGIWSGDVKLRKLELKREALDKFRLPIDVVEGYLGELTLQIPWSNLKNKPVKIFIENVYVLAVPKANQEYDEEDEERRKQQLKLEKLEDAELLIQAAPAALSPEEQKKNQSFTDSLVTKIIDNLQITVKNIHLRYEDSVSAPGHPFALGLTLAEFSAVSADQRWNPIFIQDSVVTTHKLTTLDNLAIYWNTDSDLLSENKSVDEMFRAFAELITPQTAALGTPLKAIGPNSRPGKIQQYVLKPVSGYGRITIHKGDAHTVANTRAELFFDEIGFVLDEDQYRDALMMVDLFHFYIRTEKFRSLRPKVAVKDDPRAWFQFAGKVVLREIHEKRRQWSWAFFEERFRDRRRYIELYKLRSNSELSQSVGGLPAGSAIFTAAMADELKALEWKLSFEDIRFYRSLANAQLRKEQKKLRIKQQKAAAVAAPKSAGWLAWAWGSGGGGQQKEAVADDTVMTDQQRKELYDAIEWDEDTTPSKDVVVDVPRDTVKLSLQISLKMGSFALKRDPHGTAQEILNLVFDTYTMEFLQRPDSFFVALSLQELKVHDGTTKGTLYPDIVRVKTKATDMERMLDMDSVDDQVKPTPEPVFSLSFEKNPLDSSADSSVTMKMSSMEIYYNKIFIEEIARFFRPPVSHMESFGALMYAASTTVEGITNQTRAGLEYALQEHKTLNAKLDIQAPLIIIPFTVLDRNSSCLVVDAGHISVVSNLVDKDTIREVQSKQASQYNDGDYERLKSLMYDKFQLSLEATQVLVGPTIDETIEQVTKPAADDDKHLHIVEKINMDLLVEISIIAKASNLTKFRVSGHLPILHLSVSDVKYKILMQLISSSVPDVSFAPVDAERIEELDDDRRPSVDSGRPAPFSFKSQAESYELDPYVHDASGRGYDSDDDTASVSSRLTGSTAVAAASMSDDAEFLEASEGHSHSTQTASANVTTDDVSLEQRNFEFAFTVDRVQVSLYKGFSATARDFRRDKLLVDVILEHFELMFFNRMHDMQAEVILSRLSVEDRIEADAPAEFRQLISSEAGAPHGAPHDARLSAPQGVRLDEPHAMRLGRPADPALPPALFHVKYARVSPASPEFMTLYEGIDQTVEVSISTLQFVITRRSVLTLLDFVLTTFASSDESDDSDDAASSDDDTVVELKPGGGKMKLKLNLSSIVLVLNDDGVRLATLRVDQANVAVFSMGSTMRLGARIGNFALDDDTDSAVQPELRQLVSIQGDELADLRYETFDPTAIGAAYPGYNASVYFRSGSIRVNFVEDSFRRIYNFITKFAQMKSFYDSARQAAVQQAAQMKDPDKIHLDVIVRTPIIIFSRECPYDAAKIDLITAHLGEMYVQNTFSDLDVGGAKSGPATVNKINAGIRQTSLTSAFNFPGGVRQELQMMENLDISFKMVYVEHIPGVDRPALEIIGTMSDVNVNLTESEYIFLVGLSGSLGSVFAGPEDEPEERPRKLSATDTRRRRTSSSASAALVRPAARFRPEPAIQEEPEVFTKMDFVFKLNSLGLELFNDADGGEHTARPSSLSKVAVTGMDVKMRMKSDDAIESEFYLKSFTIFDSRKLTNNFREIVPPIQHDGYQFMANISTTRAASGEQSLTAILSIDSPRIIFAIDYLFAVKSYFLDAFKDDEAEAESEASTPALTPADSVSSAAAPHKLSAASVALFAGDSDDDADMVAAEATPEPAAPAMTVAFRINVVDASVILIANPLVPHSEAIVLRIKEILLTQQNVFTLTLSEVGMYLCRMDLIEENRLRVLDDFNAVLAIDNRSAGLQHKTAISVSVDPLVLRLSLRDILLALSIVHKASELSPEQAKPKVRRPYSRFSTNRKLKDTLKKRKGKDRRRSSAAPPELVAEAVSTLLRSEELNVHFDGLRLVLIGGVHELPLLDMCIRQFPFNLRNWSTEMDASLSVEMFANVYNYSKSAWEPLVEPWHLGFRMTRTVQPENLSISFSSRKSLQVTITSQTIAILSNVVEMMSGTSDLLSKPPGADAPYRIVNQTGHTLQVWADNLDDAEYTMAKEVADGEEVPWRFDDWRKLREDLSIESQHGTVGVRLKDTAFNAVTRIPANKEGETLYVLQPRAMKVAHRLVCEVKLREDKVKCITFRSALVVENSTQIPLELLVGDADAAGAAVKTIAPGTSQAVAIGAIYDQPLRIRPGVGLGFHWSAETLFWRSLLSKYRPYVECAKQAPDDSDDPSSYFFQVHANYDRSEPLAKIYPHMRIRISAPIELQNLLPHDFNYRIYDKTTRENRSSFLRQGLASPVHVVQLSHLLMLSVHMKGTSFERSDFAVINSNSVDFPKESSFATRNQDGQRLQLRLHYFQIPDSGGAFRITVYAPYLVLNQTGLDLAIKAGPVVAYARKNDEPDTTATRRKAMPIMFSYNSMDRSNRSLLRVGDSSWSKPQSFEAIGGVTDAIIPSSDKQSEIHVGISVSEGQGKYKLTKIVAITPRFVLKNRLGEPVHVREPGSSNFLTVGPDELLPLRFMRMVPEKQLAMSFADAGAKWSAPFNIADLGRTHVKVMKPGGGQKLVKIEVIIEHATIFLYFDFEKNNWPYSIRNFSNTEFMFYQANPYIKYENDDDHNFVMGANSRFRPINYRLPKKSVMAYAWDYPVAERKELVICAHNVERHVPLSEIGDLVPMKLPAVGENGPAVIEIKVMADGPIQTLVLSDYEPSKSLYKPKMNASTASVASSATGAAGFEVSEEDTDITFRAQINLEGVGISLINSRMQELCYITFRGFEVKYNESAIYQNMSMHVKWIQIDNQLFGGIYPIVLYPSVLPQTAKEMENHPTLSGAVSRVKDDSHGVLYIKFATILLQQMTVDIDEDFLFALLDFSRVPGASWANAEEDKLCDDYLEIPEPTQTSADRDVYFEMLQLQPAQMDLSFVRTERVNVEDKTSSNNALMFFLNILTMAIGNINDAPVQLNALLVENVRVSFPMLSRLVGAHYGQQFIYQVHKVLGSADFLGNPVGLFNNLSSGVMDIFYEPYQGFIMNESPQELGIGLAKGAMSFLKKSVFGVSDSIAKVTGSISKGLAVATLDKQFQDRRRISRNRNRPKHALYGVTAGANSFVEGLTSGISGVALAPMRGATEEGTAGFFKGIGKGLVGLPTKAAIGIFDLASNVSEGIRNTTTVFDANGIDRVRLPRFIGRDMIVKPYSQREAIGQVWLKQLNEGDYFNEDYVAHLSLPGEELVVMVTYTRILLMHTQRLVTQWDVQFDQLQTISMEKGGIALILWGGVQGPFIPIAEETARQFLYNKIGTAVEDYNKYRQAVV
ncbi:uncharacterized protein V1510DRAFT_428530 [Dipodascopsis tothii]|uniref:uncharacterized protein n=1 Tax=Dipodascopsis tothii TaxID=44089 RepID=UPI0034CFD0CB